MKKIIACLLICTLGLSVNAQGVFQRMINEARNEINRTRQEYQRNNNSNQRYNNSNDSRSLQYSPYGTRPNTNSYNRSSSPQYSRPTDNSSRTESYSPRSANSSTTAVVSKPEEKLNSTIPNTNSDKEVTVVVSGDGATKAAATAMALRSAIEQAFGTFVSANTTILNDELVKDEIVSITTGNIKKYDELSYVTINGKSLVTLKAVVSISNLVSYVQNHGGATELAGKEFAMQMRIEEFNIKSEKIALKNMMLQLQALIPNLFDYTVETETLEMLSTSSARVPLKVKIHATDNTTLFNQIMANTLKSLSVAPNANIPHKGKIIWGGVDYYLRNEMYYRTYMERIYNAVVIQLISFKITTQNNTTLAFWKADEGGWVLQGQLDKIGLNISSSRYSGLSMFLLRQNYKLSSFPAPGNTVFEIGFGVLFDRDQIEKVEKINIVRTELKYSEDINIVDDRLKVSAIKEDKTTKYYLIESIKFTEKEKKEWASNAHKYFDNWSESRSMDLTTPLNNVGNIKYCCDCELEGGGRLTRFYLDEEGLSAYGNRAYEPYECSVACQSNIDKYISSRVAIIKKILNDCWEEGDILPPTKNGKPLRIVFWDRCKVTYSSKGI